MAYILKIERFFLKVENIFSNMDFIARLTTAMGVGMNAFNDRLLKRNTEQLDRYLNERQGQAK